MKKINVLVADNEPLSQQAVVREIKKEPGFEVLKCASSGTEAIREIKKQDFDVVFLDIEMPGLSGLEVAGELIQSEEAPLVVFVTAFHRYAIEAFETNAIDYILKPLDPDRFKKTLERIKERLELGRGEKQNLIGLENELIQKGVLKKIVGHPPSKKERIVIEPMNAYFFYVKHSSLFVNLGGEELVVDSTMKNLLEMLDPANFIQTHKSYIVNINKIHKVSPMFNGNYEIRLQEPADQTIPLSRRYAKSLKTRMGGW